MSTLSRRLTAKTMPMWWHRQRSPYAGINPLSSVGLHMQLFMAIAHPGTHAFPDCAPCKKFRPQLWRWMDGHMDQEAPA